MVLVIFDLDGVIVSTDAYHFKAWKTLADAYDLKFDERINHQLRGVSRRESLDIILEHNDFEVSLNTINTMLEEKNEVYKSLLSKLSKKDILPGVEILLQALKSNHIKVAIGSSSKNTPLILKRIGLEDAFDTIIDGNMISESKPNPEVFTKGANALNIPYTECVVIEDAQAGIQAAKACGMYAVGVGHLDIGADLHFESLEQVTIKTLQERV